MLSFDEQDGVEPPLRPLQSNELPPTSSDDGCQQREPRSLAGFVTAFGVPCLIAVAAIDPGNLELDLQAGHALRYSLIWVILFSSVLGWILQSLVAHLTICSGKPLAALLAHVYRKDRLLSTSLFVVAEVSVIAFDVAEVVGTAIALQLLFHWPLWVGIILSGLDTLLVLFLQQTGLTRVEIVIEFSLFLLAACLFYEFILSRPDIFAIIRGSVVPNLGPDPAQGAILGVGILGSVVMAHNLFLHSWLVYDRNKEDDMLSCYPIQITGIRGYLRRTCRYATIEAGAIFVATYLINTCVVAITASLPEESLRSLPQLGLQNAGALLASLLGARFASTAWAIALLCSGHAATVTGALASQAVCEGFLNIQGRQIGIMILASRAMAILPAMFAALVAGGESANTLVVLSQVILSLALPFAAIPMFKLLVSVDRVSHCNLIDKRLLTGGYVAFALLLVANVYVFYDMVNEINNVFGCFVAFGVCLLGLWCIYLIVKLVLTPVHLTELSTPAEWMWDTNETRPLLTNNEADSNVKTLKDAPQPPITENC
ncbi:Natural resistance-associated macrophage protein [Gracilaria domingensis]|nr:Natural resistance-associated macrophage protein [Gracilaria domingensis]